MHVQNARRRRRRPGAARAVVGDAVGLQPWSAARRARRRAANLVSLQTQSYFRRIYGCKGAESIGELDQIVLAGPSYAAGNHRARQPMLGAGNICLSLIVAIACLPAIQARSGTWQSAATPYQYNAVNYSAMNLTKVEELELRIAQLENARSNTLLYAS